MLLLITIHAQSHIKKMSFVLSTVVALCSNFKEQAMQQRMKQCICSKKRTVGLLNNGQSNLAKGDIAPLSYSLDGSTHLEVRPGGCI